MIRDGGRTEPEWWWCGTRYGICRNRGGTRSLLACDVGEDFWRSLLRADNVLHSVVRRAFPITCQSAHSRIRATALTNIATSQLPALTTLITSCFHDHTFEQLCLAPHRRHFTSAAHVLVAASTMAASTSIFPFFRLPRELRDRVCATASEMRRRRLTSYRSTQKLAEDAPSSTFSTAANDRPSLPSNPTMMLSWKARSPPCQE